MPIGVCPHCKEAFVYDKFDTDYVHECNSGVSNLDNDSVFVPGTYVDEATGVTIDVYNANLQGTANKLFGLPTANGKKQEDLNALGDPTSRFRLRKHYEHIQLK